MTGDSDLCGYSPSYGPYRVILAFDSFKGSLTATEACDAAAAAIRHAYGDDVAVGSFPMADGGEGSAEILSNDSAFVGRDVLTEDALGRPVSAHYLLSPDHREAHIEVAAACGLPQVSDVPLRPTDASTRGVGVIVADALEHGAQQIILYLGGTATTDAGTGLLTRLGVRFLDDRGIELPPGGGDLKNLSEIDVTSLMPRALHAQWTVVTDVDAPLLGHDGAARGYAPQKGADPHQTLALEEALAHLVTVIQGTVGKDISSIRGAGAAGGIGASLSALFDVAFVRGGDFFAERTGLAAAIGDADLIITGEGRFDPLSVVGKVPGTIAALAGDSPSAPKVVVIAGSVDRSFDYSSRGVTAAFSLADGPAELRTLTAEAAALLAARSVDVVGLARTV